MTESIHIRAVAFKDGDLWVVQGVEYDIVAQAKRKEDVPTAFLRTLMSTVLINEQRGRKGLEKIKPAPKSVEMMFEAAGRLPAAPSAPLDDVGRADVEYRLYEAA